MPKLKADGTPAKVRFHQALVLPSWEMLIFVDAIQVSWLSVLRFWKSQVRPPSEWMIFCKTHMKSTKTNNPTATHKQVMEMLSKQYRATSALCL